MEEFDFKSNSTKLSFKLYYKHQSKCYIRKQFFEYLSLMEIL